jgi:hypothetical protein
MAADMNEPMVTALQTALERRAAGLPQVDWKKEFKWVPNGFDDGGMWETTDAWDTREGKEARALQVREEERAAEQRARMGADLAASDEPMEAIVGRLLETAPLTDERWGGW